MQDLLFTTKKNVFYPDNISAFKSQVLQWAKQYDVICFLDNNDYPNYPHNGQEFLLAVGSEEELIHHTHSSPNGFDKLKEWRAGRACWMFGMLGYDLKNEVEDLQSSNFDGLGFPDLHFFRPSIVIECKEEAISIYGEGLIEEEVYKAIVEQAFESRVTIRNEIAVQPRIPKEQYLKTIQRIREHIIRGDIYEMNFCQEFYAEDTVIDPLQLFSELNAISQAPFSAYYQMRDRYLLCASPERFMKKEGNTLISQPIKGTIKRGDTPGLDIHLKNTLQLSDKDRSENVMIVDLVRNDLGRSCKPGTVKVEELYGIYGFNQVWQMISTISGELKADIHWIDAIKNAFPMGSMTGAPKVRSMQLIESFEESRRGLYSGAVGYIRPNGDFDFNVVIRSILYNASQKYLSFQVGGAIVYDSIPEKEYEECLLKAKGMLAVLGKGLHLKGK